mmetsp:Transcript_13254/g.18956  ORF Transcript_13254/g.18956 Transcript_13254/m.18956 type:complete len:213 (+) Transcript_13254:381-1019(+)
MRLSVGPMVPCLMTLALSKNLTILCLSWSKVYVSKYPGESLDVLAMYGMYGLSVASSGVPMAMASERRRTTFLRSLYGSIWRLDNCTSNLRRPSRSANGSMFSEGQKSCNMNFLNAVPPLMNVACSTNLTSGGRSLKRLGLDTNAEVMFCAMSAIRTTSSYLCMMGGSGRYRLGSPTMRTSKKFSRVCGVFSTYSASRTFFSQCATMPLSTK